MTIPAGTKLGAFEVSSLLGVGGAKSTGLAKLGREVALKLLPEFLERDEENATAWVLVAPEVNAYVLSSRRLLSELYLVEGLK